MDSPRFSLYLLILLVIVHCSSYNSKLTIENFLEGSPSFQGWLTGVYLVIGLTANEYRA